MFRLSVALLTAVVTAPPCFCADGWLPLANVKVRAEPTELAGPRIVVEYDLDEPSLSPELPAYVFVRFSKDAGATWQLVPTNSLRGNGFDIVEQPGHKKIVARTQEDRLVGHDGERFPGSGSGGGPRSRCPHGAGPGGPIRHEKSSGRRAG